MVFTQQVIDAHVYTYVGIAAKHDPFFFHQLYATVDGPFLQFEIGDAIAQQAAGRIIALEYGNRVAGIVELGGSGQAGRPGTYYGYLFAGTYIRLAGFYKALVECNFYDVFFYLFD